MTVAEWCGVLAVYRSCGVNCMRFHSHTPPEAAFAAADEMGMLMQPELGHWNPETAFEDEESWAYYLGELRATLRTLANHPSFTMLTFGNELACGDLGHLNHDDPDAKHDYEGAMAEVRKECAKPVFSFEVGQFEVLPDFDEINDFKGVTRAVYYELIRKKVIAEGLTDTWKRRVEATGELSNLCYREEIEAALRTASFSGISLLGIQDFPGQGTALVGMLNAHLQPKPYPFARPERFSAFFRAVLPLVLLEKYTYVSTKPSRPA